MRIALIFSLMLGIVFTPMALANARCGDRATCHQGCCKNTACCLAKNKSPEPAQQIPLQKIGHNLAGPILSNPVAILFVPRPVLLPFIIQDENRRGHSPDPLAAGCIRLI